MFKLKYDSFDHILYGCLETKFAKSNSSTTFGEMGKSCQNMPPQPPHIKLKWCVFSACDKQSTLASL